MDKDLTNEGLKELLNYDPSTGVFTWKVRANRRRAGVGDIAGYETAFGYIEITVRRKRYRAGRLAWFFMKGSWPTQLIDHINGRRTDNRIANLREVNNSENAQNQKKAKVNNKTGLLGVSPPPKGKKKHRAAIALNGKRMSIGHFDTPEEAHEAYLAVKKKIHPAYFEESKNE